MSSAAAVARYRTAMDASRAARGRRRGVPDRRRRQRVHRRNARRGRWPRTRRTPIGSTACCSTWPRPCASRRCCCCRSCRRPRRDPAARRRARRRPASCGSTATPGGDQTASAVPRQGRARSGRGRTDAQDGPKGTAVDAARSPSAVRGRPGRPATKETPLEADTGRCGGHDAGRATPRISHRRLHESRAARRQGARGRGRAEVEEAAEAAGRRRHRAADDRWRASPRPISPSSWSDARSSSSPTSSPPS